MTVTDRADWLLHQAAGRAGLNTVQAARIRPVLVAAMLSGAAQKGLAGFVARPRTMQLLVTHLPAARRLYQQAVVATRRRDKELNLSGLPAALAWLIRALLELIGFITGELQDGTINVDTWLAEFQNALAEFHAAAWMAGTGKAALTPAEVEKVAAQLQQQLQFLGDFALEVQDAQKFKAGQQARAESYANGIKPSYWFGKTQVLPLPAMPGDGTSQCLGNCRCGWRIVTLDDAKGDYDCTWELGVADHCQTCVQRAADWKPLRIRDFQLVLG